MAADKHVKALAGGTAFYAYEIAPEKLTTAARQRLPSGTKAAILSPKPLSPSKSRLFRGMRVVRTIGPRGTSAAAAAQEPKVKATAYEPSARARALLRGVKLLEEDLKSSGGAFELAQAQELMHGISRQAVNNRVRDGSLLAVPGPSNRATYPVLQFRDDGSLVGGLKEVKEALKTESPWMLLNFLANKQSRLGNRKPIDLLKAGKLDLVVEAARSVGHQGG